MTADAEHRGALDHWQGRVFLSLGRALYMGRAGDTTPHAHHALQVSIGLDASFRLRRGDGPWREYEAVVIPPDVPHQLDGRWANLLLLYLEPESREGRRWLRGSPEGLWTLENATVASLRAAVRRIVKSPPSEVDVETIHAAVFRCAGLRPDDRAPSDRRVTDALRLLRLSPDSRRSLSDLAARVGLSPRRFRHLFRHEIGMSAQSYIVWLRIHDACAALAGGTSLSSAALEAGFSDAAHFSRTFRRTFGLAPSQVAPGLTLVGESMRAVD